MLVYRGHMLVYSLVFLKRFKNIIKFSQFLFDVKIILEFFNIKINYSELHK